MSSFFASNYWTPRTSTTEHFPYARPRLLAPRNYRTAPPTLIKKYIETRFNGTDPGLFAYLMLPVFERKTRGPTERPHQIHLWSRLPKHRAFNLGWITMGWASKSSEEIEHALFLRDESLRELDYEESRETRVAKRIENDIKFVEIMVAIGQNDIPRALDCFYDTYIAPDDVNWCFGMPLIGFAMMHGKSLEMLKTLLTSVKSVRQKHLYRYILIAMRRRKDRNPQAYINLLLNKVSGFDTAKKPFTISLIQKAISNQAPDFFAAVLRWFHQAPDFPKGAKLQVLEWYYNTSLYRNGHNTLDLLIWPKRSDPAESLLSPRLITAAQKNPDNKAQLHALFDACQPVDAADSANWYYCDIYMPLLFVAAERGQMHWVEWFLWAGADPRHLEGDKPFLDYVSSRASKHYLKELLEVYGWDVEKLEVVLP